MFKEFINDNLKEKLNLLKTYLRDVVEPAPSAVFDMSCFYSELDDEDGELWGTKASPMGWMAMCLGHTCGYDGVDVDDVTIPWHKFSAQVLEIDEIKAMRVVRSWLDDTEWKDVDNSLEGAIKRIDYLIEHGVPDDFIENDSHDKNDYLFTIEGFKRGYEAYLDHANRPPTTKDTAKAIVINVVRFNETELPILTVFIVKQDTDIEKIKKALVEFFEASAEDIIENHLQDDNEEVDSDTALEMKEDRKQSLERVITGIKDAKQINDLKRHTTLNDGFDVDTEEPIYSYIDISIQNIINIH